jgi:DNA-binding NarL/FixJ family response regulator
MTAARILLADDHQMVREGVRALLERAGFAIVAETDDGARAVQLAQTDRPDIAVLDVEMPGLGGIDCARAILSSDLNIGVVLLTVHSDEYQVVTALRAGVRGYVVKTQACAELVHAIRQVSAGGIYLSGKVSRVLVNLYLAGGIDPDAHPLTPRLREVLRLIAEGTTTKDIAGIIGVSEKTAELYRSRIMMKLDIHDTAGLVRYAIRCGLIAL